MHMRKFHKSTIIEDGKQRPRRSRRADTVMLVIEDPAGITNANGYEPNHPYIFQAGSANKVYFLPSNWQFTPCT